MGSGWRGVGGPDGDYRGILVLDVEGGFGLVLLRERNVECIQVDGLDVGAGRVY